MKLPATATIPHQSRGARFPGITLAASDLGVTRTHLWQVLSGNRTSLPLMVRWQEWLASHPEFSGLNAPPAAVPLPMPTLQVSAATTARSQAAALHAAYHAMVDRAKKVTTREPHLITTFTLGDEIDQILTQASHSMGAGDFTTATALRLVATRLSSLITAH